MTFSPTSMLLVRDLFRRRTGLPAVSLGIQHFSPQGGGYHEGNDLLRAAGREHTDYSKRESARDRPGSDAASAIDIGRFSVNTARGRITNHDMVRWFLREIAAGAPDTAWIREIIYSLNDWDVERYDALDIRTSGDISHRTHEHFSSFRDDIDSPNILGVFERFWRWADQVPEPTPAPTQEAGSDMEFVYAPGRGWALVSSDRRIFNGAILTQEEANAVGRFLGRNARVVSAGDFDIMLAVLQRMHPDE